MVEMSKAQESLSLLPVGGDWPLGDGWTLDGPVPVGEEDEWIKPTARDSPMFLSMTRHWGADRGYRRPLGGGGCQEAVQLRNRRSDEEAGRWRGSC